MNEKRAMTVLGPVPAESLGVTLPHEHLLFDQVRYASPRTSDAEKFADVAVEMRHLGALRRNAGLIPENGRVDDADLAAREAAEFKRAGGGTIVDVSCNGLGRDPAGLSRVAMATGLNIITCCGYYKGRGHPPEMAERSVDDVAAEFVKELTTGIGNTGIRAGVIGEIATGGPLYEVPREVQDLTDHSDMEPTEEKVLRAAGRAQAETDAPVSVHIYNYRPNRLAHHALDVLYEEGADLQRVTICHLDTRPDADYVASIADRGAFVEFDTFGIEFYSDSSLDQMARDTDRMDLVVETIKRGYIDHILLSHDVCWKTLLVEYGGWGYAHLTKNIEPRLRDAGVTDEQIRTMRVANPARWLTF
jgi:phosphotriesterase-related protein